MKTQTDAAPQGAGVAVLTHDDGTDMTRRSFIGRTTTAAAVAGTAGALTYAGTAAAAPKAPGAPRATAANAGASPLPDLRTVQAADRDLVDHDVVELATLLQAGEVSSVELTQAYIARIKELNGPFEVYGDNGGYNAFVRIDEAGALAEARVADERLSAARRGGEPAPWLCGIPMGFKDSIGTKGFAQKNGTTAYSGNVAIEDSTPVGRLRSQGVVAVGITICSAFSGAISGTFAGNAWNKQYVPGGSSQGSGVAPIARLVAATLGEETGGSIIFPAACNGASAIKPSLGLGSTAGVMPLSPSYDVIGPLARSGRDAAMIMNAIAGPDPLGDPQTTFAPIPFPQLPMVPRLGSKPLAGITFGINKKDWLTTPAGTRQDVDPQSLYEPEHAAAFARVIGELEAMGATVKEFDGVDFLVISEDENPYYNANQVVLQTIDGAPITPSAAVINPNRYDIRYVEAVEEFATNVPEADEEALRVQYGRTPGTASGTGAAATRTFAGANALLAGVTASVRAEGERRRRQFAANYKRKMAEAGVDIMLVMTLGGKPSKRADANGQPFPVRRNNQLANALSFPMVSFPIGYTSDGLPINVDLKAPRFAEGAITQVMIDYQARHPEHHTARPKDEPVTPVASGRRSAAAKAAATWDADPTLSNDPLVHEVHVA